VPESETAKAANAMERATRPEKICMIGDLSLVEEVGYSSGEQFDVSRSFIPGFIPS